MPKPTPDSNVSIFLREVAAISGFTTNFNQGVILQNLRAYLQKNNRDKAFIKKLEQGYCSGISSLWLYAKWLQTQQKDSAKERDDYNWFQATTKLIADWDGKRKLTEKEAAEFERFISYIEYFQNIEDYQPTRQGDLDRSLEDTKKQERTLKKEYVLTSLFTLDQLKKLLRKEELMQNNKLILITSHNHDTALFRNGNDYYYFDPNSPLGEIHKTSTDEIAELIFAANNFSTKTPSPLAFRFFTMNEVSHDYPPVKEVLDDIKPALTTKKKYAGGTTGLIMAAARFGSLESAKYFLDSTAYQALPQKTKKEQNMRALNLAAYYGHTEIIKEFLAHGADPNPTVDTPKPSILVRVKQFLNRNLGLKLEIADNTPDPPLLIAIKEKHTDAAVAILENGKVDPNIQDKQGFTALLLAADAGNMEIVVACLKKRAPPAIQINLDLLNNSKKTALLVATQKGHTEIVGVLLANGANPNIKDGNGMTALMWAAYKGNTKLVEEILKNNCDINLENDRKQNALILAAEEGHVEIVKKLLAKGAKIDIQDKAGKTALTSAAKMGRIEIVKELLDKGANPDITVGDSIDALTLAAYGEYLDVIHALLTHQNFKKRAEKSILQAFPIIAGTGQIKSLKTLAAEAKILGIDLAKEAETACIIAAQNNHLDVVKFIFEEFSPKIQANMSLNEKNQNALMMAAKTGTIEDLETFLDPKFNIDKNAEDRDGNTALLLALKGKKYYVAKKLLENPAVIIPKPEIVRKKLGDPAISIFNLRARYRAYRDTQKALSLLETETKKRQPGAPQKTTAGKKAGGPPPGKDSAYVLKRLSATDPSSTPIDKATASRPSTYSQPKTKPQKEAVESALITPAEEDRETLSAK